jgi:hypothetical protein
MLERETKVGIIKGGDRLGSVRKRDNLRSSGGGGRDIRHCGERATIWDCREEEEETGWDRGRKNNYGFREGETRWDHGRKSNNLGFW